MLKFITRALRPNKFADVVGQNISVKLIHKGLLKNLLGPVVLLYGPAGTGKTTLARLIALWYACELNQDEPCGKCNECISIINNSHTDVLELDGASNTSVEAIRSLLEGVIYKPATARKKVYIIDEVHMLSKSAISALLKTLEEPADHVQFVLATTEVAKLPQTLTSRSFKVGLEMVKKDVLLNYLNQILSMQGWTASNEALNIIIDISGGSVRQALSILEQVSILNDGDIDTVSVQNMLNIAADADVRALYKALITKSVKDIYEICENNENVSAVLLVKQLMTYIRQLTIEKSIEKGALLGTYLSQASVTLHQSPYPNQLLPALLSYAAFLINQNNNDNENQEISLKNDAQSMFSCNNK